ncbi:DUF2586 domain-containing protein [Providencia hangzhouensis]|uniref:DUF2586 domain-containing protein n=1 Tax=Providencia hangzhouensis TaxID=3031799 RepID=UPI0034DD0D09
MTWPTVTINQLNQRQGRIDEIERTVLFIGTGTQSNIVALNSQSDIAVELAEASKTLRDHVTAAQLNAGQNWQAYTIIMPENSTLVDWQNAIIDAQDLVSVEGCIAITEFTDASEARTTINQFAALRETLISRFGRWVWFVLSTASPVAMNETGQSWSEYTNQLADIAKDIAAPAIMLVPSLWGNDAGVLAGRLCRRDITIADSPARVKTGALVGLGANSADLPVDSLGIEITLAQLQTLHDLRYSVPMWYPDYEGFYWSDGNTLEVKGGDYPVIEYLRIVDKAARQIRLRAIAKIGDRSMNSTPGSMAAHQLYFSAPLREMSKSTQIQGNTFPGEIEPPEDDAITIQWTDKETVSVYMVIKPYASPKKITVGIILDATLEG